MAIIPQQTFFVWSEIEKLCDLERLKLVIEYMPDEELMQALEKERGKGRDDYPVRAMWNSILAGVVYQHNSVESLRRELSRNGQLRFMCGFKSQKDVPGSDVYSRFFKKLFEKEDIINGIFNKLVDELEKILPGFGKNLAIDGKAISSLAGHKNKNKEEDGRRDIDADWAKKEYKGINKNGTAWSKIVKWFGYRLHLIVDADYELPVAFEVTKASTSEIKKAHTIFEQLNKNHPEIIKKCETVEADRGYDDTKLIIKLWDEYKIKPVIDIRNMWKDGEETRQLSNIKNVVYNYKGNVYCYCLETGERREMCNGGFEKDRNMLKKICPAKQYGLKCKCMDKCPAASGLRISLEENRRIFTPIDRSSYKWERLYKKRTSVERVNSRLDGSFGFEKHYIRGLKKMKIRCGIALCVMLAMAVGRIKEKQEDKMRSLVKSA
ncbi:transposase [Aceticella autotrophica]|uniref:Transposase n=1 Tax=Aceticella autotrophica TaxID=2755338 RepID=A0A974Y2U5_9THEO|nr:transposase [Aceticella autotrophica]QSZ26574.1 transposase [Aceticella autotrophica]